MIRPAELIERKRDGGELTAEEMNELMLAAISGMLSTVPVTSRSA